MTYIIHTNYLVSTYSQIKPNITTLIIFCSLWYQPKFRLEISSKTKGKLIIQPMPFNITFGK